MRRLSIVIMVCFTLSSCATNALKNYTSLNRALKKHDSVLNLNLSNQSLESIPPEIGHLNNLEYLNLSQNKLSEIPIEIFDLENLVELNLARNKLSEIPSKISNLKNLQRLWLSSNPIKSIPNEIGELKNLKILIFVDNVLSDDEKDKLKNLLPNCEIRFSMVY